MDFLQQLGPLALASRLKRLTDRLYRSGEQVYSELELNFEPRWFMVFARLKEAGSTALPITAIAGDLGVTHPGVIKLVRELEREGLVVSARDQNDARKRAVRLTTAGRRLADQLEPVWSAFETATRDLFEEIDGDLIALLDRLEAQLAETPFPQRIRHHIGGQPPAVEIVNFHADLARHFRTLNEVWLEKMFRIEEKDRRQMDNPHEEIIGPGGDILFARLGGRIVGTVALIRLSARRMELAKMAVKEGSRRQGVGTALLNAAIERTRQRGAVLVVLQTHPAHREAISLYRRRGFEERKVRIPGAGKLERALHGFTMALDLKSTHRFGRKRS